MYINNIKNNKYKVITTVFAIFIASISFVNASTNIFFETDSKNIYQGDTFSIDFKISPDKPINVIDGTLIYDKTILLVKELNIDDSLFSLWAKKPTFDNNNGTITFIAGVPGGLKGKDAQVLRITFLAKNDGQTKIDFKDVFRVYLNDGLGTVINPWLEPLHLSIFPSQTEIIIKQSIQTLVEKDRENNHIPLIILVTFSILMLFMFLSRGRNKRKNKSV